MKHLGGHRSKTDDNVETGAKQQLKGQDTDFYGLGI
jgi:hypothetical protein